MSGSAAKVVITERQQGVLRKMSTATTVAKRLVQRATIILLAFAGMSNEDIAPRVGLERHQIGIWRRRWQRAFNDLVRIECTEDSAAALRHAIEGVPRRTTSPPARSAASRMCPPSGVYRAALVSRLPTTWASRVGSASSNTGSDVMLRSSLCRRAVT